MRFSANFNRMSAAALSRVRRGRKGQRARRRQIFQLRRAARANCPYTYKSESRGAGAEYPSTKASRRHTFVDDNVHLLDLPVKSNTSSLCCGLANTVSRGAAQSTGGGVLCDENNRQPIHSHRWSPRRHSTTRPATFYPSALVNAQNA